MLDIYRIMGMLTRDEDADVRGLGAEFAEHATVVEAHRIASCHYIAPDGIGRLRIREHPLYTAALDLDRLGKELDLLLGVSR